MIDAMVICEGKTELDFVLHVIRPELELRGVRLFATLLQSPKGKGRGGNVGIDRLAQHIAREAASGRYTTTLVDLYGFRDRNDRSATQLESEIKEAVLKRQPGLQARYVAPYVQRHEFEGLLFSDPAMFAVSLLLSDTDAEQLRIEMIEQVRQFASPEEINGGALTAPSKRILELVPAAAYSKAEQGHRIAKAMGLSIIRMKCPRFNEWIERLEGLGAGADHS